MSFSNYIKQLCLFVLSSSFVLGLILGVSLLVVGEASMNVNGDLGFGGFDGILLILALPILSILIFVLLSPLSFFVHKFLSKQRAENVAPDP